MTGLGGCASAASSSACSRGKSVLPEAMTGISARMRSSDGSWISATPASRAWARRASSPAAGLAIASTTFCPLRGQGSAAAPSGSPGQTSAASASTAASETISPPDLGEALGPADDRHMARPRRSARCRRCRTSRPPAARSARRPRRAGSRPSRSGPRTNSRSPSTPGTGSSRCSIPGSSRPTVPGRGSSRSFSAITGPVSVAP